MDQTLFPNGVWAIDTEFNGGAGNTPSPVCLVAREIFSSKIIRLWRDDLLNMEQPPFPIDNHSLIVAYYASAEMGVFRSLGWPMPARVLDLFCEFRVATNGKRTIAGNGLLGALAAHKLSAIDAAEKHEMRDLILSGGPWSDSDKTAILDYCQSDTDSLALLLKAMWPNIDLPRALLRGRYMCAAAAMEYNGVPIDSATLNRLRIHWQDIQDRLIQKIDADYGVYEGRTFKKDLFAAWLRRNAIAWPMTDGRLDLSDEVFREMSRSNKLISPLRELRVALSQMRLADLAVGEDSRNRTILSAFRAKTGRNQPSNSKFIFGPAVWLRGLIQPKPHQSVCMLDWSQQEFGVAAALSQDRLMQEAYVSGDPYMTFAIQAGAAPIGATKSTHADVRDLFKACVLAVQYGMGEDSLAARIGKTPMEAKELLRRHRETYRIFWDWSERIVNTFSLTGKINTVFGWPLYIDEYFNARSVQNFPMQANGAEMLRLACCLGIERGIEICAPVHDAVLITAHNDQIEDHVEEMRMAMQEASRIVLSGFELRSDVKIIRYPDRFIDPRGAKMWSIVMELLASFPSEPT